MSRAAPPSSDLLDIVWLNFDFDAVAHALFAKAEPFLGFRAILLAALGSWIIAPNEKELRHLSISQQTLKLCIKSEHAEMAKVGSSNLKRNTHNLLESGFLQSNAHSRFRDFYQRIGGLQTIAVKNACTDLQAEFLKRASEIYKVSEVIRIYHFCSDLPIDDYYRPSLLKGSDIVKELWGRKQADDGAVDGRNIRRAYANCRSSLALIYAASMIGDPKHETLLLAICRGFLPAVANIKNIASMFAYARYIQETIFPTVYKNGGIGVPIDMHIIERKAFRISPFDDRQTDIIRRAFKRQPGVIGGAKDLP